MLGPSKAAQGSNHVITVQTFCPKGLMAFGGRSTDGVLTLDVRTYRSSSQRLIGIGVMLPIDSLTFSDEVHPIAKFERWKNDRPKLGA